MSQTPFANSWMQGLGLGSDMATRGIAARQRDEALALQQQQDLLAASQWEQQFGYRKQHDAADDAFRAQDFAFRQNEFGYRQGQDIIDNRYRDEALQLRQQQDAQELHLRAQALKDQQDQNEYQRTMDEAAARADAQMYGSLSGINPYIEQAPPKDQFGPPIAVANPEYGKALDTFRKMSPHMRAATLSGLQERQWAREDEERKKREDLQAVRDMERQLKEENLDGPHDAAVVRAMLDAKRKGIPFTKADAIQTYRDSIRGELSDKAQVAQHVAKGADAQYTEAAKFVGAIESKVQQAQQDEGFVNNIRRNLGEATDDHGKFLGVNKAGFIKAGNTEYDPALWTQRVQNEVRRQVMSSFSPQVLQQYGRLTQDGGLETLAKQRDQAYGGVDQAFGELQKTFEKPASPDQQRPQGVRPRMMGPEAPVGTVRGTPWADTTAVPNYRNPDSEPGRITSREPDTGNHDWELSPTSTGVEVRWGGKAAAQFGPDDGPPQMAAKLKAAGIPRAQAEQILRAMLGGGDE